MINVEEKVQELINSTDKIAKEIFENPNKMRDFLKTLGKMYNTSYNNILLLKSQKENVSFVSKTIVLSKNTGVDIKYIEGMYSYIKNINIKSKMMKNHLK